jgi:hypothetical protein
LSIFTVNGVKYLVGVQVARLLKRKTFNMYRCMKKKKIPIRRASPQEVEFLCSVKAVRSGTHSITLVPYADGLYFIADALYRNIRFPNDNSPAKRQSYVNTKPKLHRRKPMPWDVQRSVKKSSASASSSPTSMSACLDEKQYHPSPMHMVLDPQSSMGPRPAMNFVWNSAGSDFFPVPRQDVGHLGFPPLVGPQHGFHISSLVNASDDPCIGEAPRHKANRGLSLSSSLEGRAPGPVVTPTRMMIGPTSNTEM